MQSLVIKLSALDTQTPAYCFLDKKTISSHFVEVSWEEIARLKYSHCIVLIPSTEVTLNTLELPTKSYSQLMKAIPYALENDLADDIKDLHFSFHRPKNAALETATIKKARLKQWQLLLSNYNIKVQTILPDLFALPVIEEGCSLILLNDQATVRCSNFSGFTTHASILSTLLNQLSKEEGQVLTNLLSNQQEALTDLNTEIEQECYLDLANHCHKDLVTALPLNLLRGIDEAQHSAKKIPYSKSIVALSLFCLGLWTAQTAYNNHSAHQKVEKLHNAINTMFSETLPNRNVDSDYQILNSQMQNELKKYNVTTTKTVASPLKLLHMIAEKLTHQNSVSLLKINYDRKGLHLTLSARSTVEIDSIIKGLPENISAKKTTSNTSANKVRAIILINEIKS
ncbi:MAG: hypothetical protein KAH22_01445 [Thiotrichaceae bacterium]|nr:hypothetical protein [Thiotrichaceae bacterium]